MKTKFRIGRLMSRGFTLTEVMFSSGIITIIIAGVFPVYFMYRQVWGKTSLDLETTRRASTAIEHLVYGTGNNAGLRGARNVTVSTNVSGGWHLEYTDVEDKTNSVTYIADATNGTISATPGPVTIGRYVTAASILQVTGGIHVAVTVARSDGRFSSTRTMGSFVSYRNDQ